MFLKGSGSYKPGGEPAVPRTTTENKFFPKTSYLTFDTVNSEAVLGMI